MSRRVVPTATYRLQFNRHFTFPDAQRLVPYLHRLGISHVYTSPLLKARVGSPHGYDIVDHDSLNPELGADRDFLAYSAALKRHGMGQILDIVPNHMGVWSNDNAWWLDIMEHGEASPYAAYFDIDWHPPNPTLKNKVLVPCLGDHYGAVLEAGELRLRFDSVNGTFAIHYFRHLFPLDPRTYPKILAPVAAALARAPRVEPQRLERLRALLSACRALPRRTEPSAAKRARRVQGAIACKQMLAELCRSSPPLSHLIDEELRLYNGTPGAAGSFDRLHHLLESQAYRLAYWLVATDEINYRRFLDINDLAGLRMDHPGVFAAAHGLIRRLHTEGHIDGFRVDHPDGLSDPYGYLRDLQDLAARPDGATAYVVVEKILAEDESLPADWPVCGTTGYEVAHLINGLFVHPDAARSLERTYSHFIGRSVSFEQLLYGRKKLIMRTTLAGELTVLANIARGIACSDRRYRDFTYLSLREALAEIVAWFPVYRTYLTRTRASETDRRYLLAAIATAKRCTPAKDVLIFDYLGELLTLRTLGRHSARVRRQILQLVLRFQQYTAPVMAKALEDTTFYIYNRLLSQNDVGFDPRRFALSCEAFHQANAQRLAAWPHSMICTSTHDSKRSEDVRARLNVLSELPEQWQRHVASWRRLNRRRKPLLGTQPALSPNDEYLLYQTLIGTWPHGPLDDAGRSAYCDRIVAYMLKAVNEAKVHTSWINPNRGYEQSVRQFVTAVLLDTPHSPFLRDFLPFQQRVAAFGMLNSLAQTLLKLTVPGVPDLYQGNECWALQLADPDNRRPVDYAERKHALQALQQALDQSGDRRELLAELRATMADGRVKLYLTWTTLALRAAQPLLFADGDYRGLATAGEKAGHICAFTRGHRDTRLVVAVARWFARLAAPSPDLPLGPDPWAGTWVECPTDAGNRRYRNVLDGQTPAVTRRDGRSWFSAQALFEHLPVALLGNC